MITTIKKVTNTTGSVIGVLCHGCGQYIELHDGLQMTDMTHDCTGAAERLITDSDAASLIEASNQVVEDMRNGIDPEFG